MTQQRRAKDDPGGQVALLGESQVQLRPQTWLFLLECRARHMLAAGLSVPTELSAEIHQLQRDIYPWAALTA